MGGVKVRGNLAGFAAFTAKVAAAREAPDRKRRAAIVAWTRQRKREGERERARGEMKEQEAIQSKVESSSPLLHARESG
jgi:hypothetical protein